MTSHDTVVWVYFIICKRGDLYIGVSNDPVARFRQHATGAGAKSMRLLEPVRLLGALPFSSRTEALRAEFVFKRLSRAKKLALASIGSRDPEWHDFARTHDWPSFVFRYASSGEAPDN